jgi:SAM-dependent methyltransferase
MSALRKAKSAGAVWRAGGLRGLFRALHLTRGRSWPKGGTPLWRDGIGDEIEFWDAWLRTKGLQWPEDYRVRCDPERVLQPTVAALLPTRSKVHILDVGAGPLTCLGKTLPGKEIEITAIDVLADEWDRLLERYRVQPLVRSQRLAAEELTTRFAANTFDLAFAQNSIDHCHDPERAIAQMIDVVKSGCYVLLQHAQNEGDCRGWAGLHQWNFSVSGGALTIASRRSFVNVTDKYAGLCRIECESL